MSDFNDDIEYADQSCPKCGSSEVMRRECDCLSCDEGFIDEHEDDPINYMEGEMYRPCSECGGHGAHVWCRNCGWDLLEKRYLNGSPEVAA
jgi:predicted RNA-binding Zn-ribbon protein involved in translation (DUF1610 family)